MSLSLFSLLREGEEAVSETVAEETATEAATGFDWTLIWTRITEFAVSIAGRLLLALVVLIVGKLLIRVFLGILRRSHAMKKADVAVSRFLVSFFKMALNILLVVILIGVLGVPMSSLVGVITAAAAAIGLALQGALGNLAGGIMILVFHPFHLDDYIETCGYSGTVTDIGIFYTVLKTVDNREVTVPNGTIMANAVTNYSAFDLRRLDLDFSVAYGTDIDKVHKALLETAEAHPMVLKEPAAFARLTAHENSALKFTMRVWVKKEDYWDARFDLIEQVNRRFAADGIQIPFDQLDVHVVSNQK